MRPGVAGVVAVLALCCCMAADAFEEITAAFEATPELRRHHDGYLGYLKAHPDMQRAEEAWNELAIQTRFAQRSSAFDEALRGDVELERLFDGFYDQLARDGDLRAAVEGLRRTELGQKRWADTLVPALGYLRAHPDTALRFLERPGSVVPTPEPLYAIRDWVRDHPENAEALRVQLGQLAGQAGSHTRAFPWWQGMSEASAGKQATYARLSEHFMAHSSHFWVFHQRYLALAQDAQARNWIRYWHRRVRREPALARRYYPYLQHLRNEPEPNVARDNEDTASTWPPKQAPPLLSALTIQGVHVPEKEHYMPRINRPAKPLVARPAMPLRPAKPARPANPERPSSPESPREPGPNTPGAIGKAVHLR